MPRICNCKSNTLFCTEACSCGAGDESCDNVLEHESVNEDSITSDITQGIVFKNIIVVYLLLKESHGSSNVRALVKVRKRAKIRNRYNQAPHLAKDTTGIPLGSDNFTN